MNRLLIILLLPLTFAANAQNMVPNPSFEKRSSDPRTFAQFRRVIDWAVPNFSTPDYFCCGKVYYSGEENTKIGDVKAYDGEAFAGIVVYSKAHEEYHEYIYTQLSDTLTGGQKYEVKFKVLFEAENAFHVDGFGFALAGRFDFEGDTANHEVHSKDFPKGEWVEVSKVIEAQGGESHLFIGTFKTPEQMDIIRIDRKLEFKQTYVYIDMVSVTPIG